MVPHSRCRERVNGERVQCLVFITLHFEPTKKFSHSFPGEIIGCISFERFTELIIVAFMADCFV